MPEIVTFFKEINRKLTTLVKEDLSIGEKKRGEYGKTGILQNRS